MNNRLKIEADKIESMLKGKVIEKVFRPSENDICIQCTDGTRFFIDTHSVDNTLEFSITD